jgi:hypothetical protein
MKRSLKLDQTLANLEMMDSYTRAPFETDRKVMEAFLSQSTLQSTPQLEASEGFRGRSMPKLEIDVEMSLRRGEHCNALQGHCAY